MSAETILAMMLGLALLVAWGRLLWWWRQGEPKPATWRLAALLVLQPAWLGLLFLMLLPPRTLADRGRLTILTADWGRTAPAAGPAVALPEAEAGTDIERAPDLATALRRHGATAVTIVGRGLEARDRDGLDLPLAFDPAPLPSGLVGIVPLSATAPGAAFTVHGRVQGLGGSVELDDPAGRRIDAVALAADGAFTLSGTAREAGLATFALKLRDSGGAIVEQADVPLQVAAPVATRMLLIGTPDPESKYLRRWATDAGLAVDARLSAGGGITLGDGASIMAALPKADVVVIDDRGWGALSPAEKAAVLGAVRGGAGMLLRATGPLAEPVAREWRGLGFGTSGGALVPLTLPKEAPDAAAIAARRGSVGEGENAAPALTRSDLHIVAADGAAFPDPDWLRPLARWRAFGRGRIGIETITDSYALGLAGQKARYGELWSSLIGTVGAPHGAAAASVSTQAHVGERVTLCGVTASTAITGAGETAQAIPDPAAGGCAGFWSRRAGWHRIGTQPFYVWPSDQLKGVRAAAIRDATLALVRDIAAPASTKAQGPRGSSWPWFLGWLVVGTLLWWLERARVGRSAQVQHDQPGSEDDIE